MGTKYSSQATSGYNSSPPPDDGTQVASNLITWAGVKTKLADVLKTFGEAINTALVSALDLSARAIASNDTAIASDHWKTLQVTGATTIQLSSAASMGGGYEVGVFNAGASTVTVSPAGSDTINNISASVTVPIKGTMIFRTNQALTGYNVVGQSNRMDAGTISGITSFAAQGAGTFTSSLVWGTGTANFGTITKRKTADESVTSSTAFQDDDHLTFAIAANEEWVVTYLIDVKAYALTAAGGFKAAITTPAGATQDFFGASVVNLLSSAVSGRTQTSGASIVIADSGTGSAAFVTIGAWILNGATPGNVTLQWAQSTVNGTATTVAKGSFLQATRIA